MKMRLIGDIHGDYRGYQEIISSCEDSIQVGDFGVGFVEDNFERSLSHRFIRGNHDNPELCKQNKYWIQDSTIYNDIYCIGGGYSIDKEFRTEGIDWWNAEELSYGDMRKAISIYADLKPLCVVSHEGPVGMIQQMFSDHKMFPPSRTSLMLEEMFKLHKPNLWVFGHWHKSRLIKIDKTQFICLGINSYIDINV